MILACWTEEGAEFTITTSVLTYASKVPYGAMQNSNDENSWIDFEKVSITKKLAIIKTYSSLVMAPKIYELDAINS